MIKGFFSKKVFLFVFLVIAFCPRESWAANRYWIGGTGNWSDTAHWSNMSGGAGNQSVPGSSDKAFFDGSSGGGTCTVDQTVNVRGLDMQSGNTTTLSQGANSFTVGTGNAAFTGGTFTGGSSTIDVNGTFTVNGAGFTSTSGTMFCAKAFTFSSGTFTHNSGTVEFDTNNLTISPGSAIFNNVTFNANKTFTISSGQTLTVNGTLNLTDGTVNTGTLGSKGAINLATTFDGGSATLDISGTSAQTFTGGGSASTGECPAVNINKSSGTLTLASTIRTGSDWTYTQGTVDAGSSTVVFADNNLSITGSMNFNHLTFDSGGANKTVTIGAGTTLTVTGTLSLTNYTINGGTLAPEGNVTVGASADGGTTSLSLTATGDQTITGNSGGDFQDNLTINKSSGTVTLTGTCTGIQNITVTAGTLDFDGGFTYTIDNTDTIAVVSGAAINFTGSSGSLVTLKSDQNNSAWTLNVNTGATYQADFVDVKDSNATGQDIFASNSTDNGGNTNWFFVPGTLTSTDVEPDSLSAGAEGLVTISFTTANVIPINGLIVIDFPSGFDGTGSDTLS
ncbi:hypothetical protein IIB34_07675, partial [PVC group bacterium]|nr:hypothetical protein [PVC group bacterium]